MNTMTPRSPDAASGAEARKTKPQLENEWSRALSGVFDEEMTRRYVECLASAYVELSDAEVLGSSEFSELGIPIGHRKFIRAYAAVASTKLAEEEGEATLKASMLSATGDESHYITEPSLTEGTHIEVHDRVNASKAVTWVDVSGSAPSVSVFLNTIEKLSTTIGMRGDMGLMMGAFGNGKPMPMFVSGKCSSLLLMRLPDLSDDVGTTLASITNRLILWWPAGDDSVVLSYHRCDVNPLSSLMEEWESSATYAKASRVDLFTALVQSVIRTYRTGIKQLQRQYTMYEDMRDAPQMISKMTVVQKQAVVFHRCLVAMRDVFDEMEMSDAIKPQLAAHCNQYSASVETLAAHCNELNENISSTINLQVALDGFRASVNMKIFTYLSVVCQPIAVATGWYGMNFDNMPDLHYKNSYFVFIGIIGCVVLMLTLWLVVRIVVGMRSVVH